MGEIEITERLSKCVDFLLSIQELKDLGLVEDGPTVVNVPAMQKLSEVCKAAGFGTYDKNELRLYVDITRKGGLLEPDTPEAAPAGEE